MPTVLFEESPSGLRLDSETNLVHWKQNTNGHIRHAAMPYPVFVRSCFAAMAFIERTNAARERAALEADSEGPAKRILPISKSKRAGE